MSRFFFLVLLLLFGPVASAAPPAVMRVAYSARGDLIAFGAHDTIRVFDAAKHEPRGVAKSAGRITALAFSPNGEWLAAAGGEPGQAGSVQFYRIRNQGQTSATIDPEPARRIIAHKDLIYALAFAPDGKTLATAGYDRLIHLWTVLADGVIAKAPHLTLKDHSDTIYDVAFHPDGNLLASAGADRAVKVWDVVTGKRLYTLGDPTDWVYCIRWSPDKKHLAAGGVDKTIRIWAADKNGGKLVHSVFAHEKPVWRIAYAEAGTTLYSVGEDRIVKSWSAATMSEKKVLNPQPDAILDFAIAPGGKQLALGRFDGVALLLDTANGKATVQLLPPKPLPPKAAKLTPTGIPLGKSSIVTVTGANLDFTTRVTSSRPDVKADIVGRAPGELKLTVTAPKEGSAVVDLTFEGDAGKSTLKLALDRFAAIPEAGVTDSARASQDVKLPATIAGAIDRAGDVDYFRFQAKAGDQIGLQVTAAELGSKLAPALVLTDAGGATLAEGTTSLGFTITRAGSYAIGIRDRDYRGGADFTYRLHIGPIPVVTGVFPLAVQRGRDTEVYLDGVNLGAPGGIRTHISVPTNAVPGSRISVPLPKNSIGKAEVIVSEFPSMVVDPVAGADLRIPGSADGILSKPNEHQLARFQAKKGQRLAVEVLARRAGSPVDPIIEILDTAGKPVPRALLRATAKTYTTFRDHDSAGPGIRLDAWNELALDDYLFVDGELTRILALPKGPDDDCQFYQVAGQRVGFLGTTPAHHSQGSPMYKVEIHPPDKSFPPNGLPLFTLQYRNDDGGPGFGKDSFLLFDPPADGVYQVRVSDANGGHGPTHAYHLTVRPPKPGFGVSFNPTTPSIRKGEAVSIGVTITRQDGFDGPVRVQLDGLPAGLQAPSTSIEAGQTTTAFALHADAGAIIPPNAKLKLVARAHIAGREVVQEALGGMPKLIEPGDIVTRTSTSEIRIKPGQESRFHVEVERRGKFAGRVPVEVRGLPHGVRVLNIGLNGILITERESRREVVLYAEPWVKPMERPIVVLAKSEAKNTEHAAKSVILKVAKP